ncbi:MAG TPA: hypothetical protein VE178_13155 [Silvibacterium sp.]|jgi:hypothetical protein|nr:hypothetical protein [Silvibacterium sp.]
MKPTNHRGIKAIFLAACVCLALPAAGQPQVVQPIGTFNSPQNRRMQTPNTQEQISAGPAASPAASPAQSFAAPPASTTPPSLLDKPPQPAKVNLAAGRLTIHADNSSLSEILHQLTADGGMTVDGLGKDERIFGDYGPGDPQEILSELLDGSGYNMVMLGRTDAGTPKQLTLTPRIAGPVGASPTRQQATNQDDEIEEEPQPPPPAAEAAPQPSINPRENGPGVRTPQQMLQELQQMRQQQLQQQQGQQPPPQQQ